MEPDLKEEAPILVADLAAVSSEGSTAPTAPSHNATTTGTTTGTTTSEEDEDDDMSRYIMQEEHGATVHLPGIILKKTKKVRRKIVVTKKLDIDPQSLQELDDAVASVSSGMCHSPRRRDEDDVISACSHTFTTSHDSLPAAYRKVIDAIPGAELHANRLLNPYGRSSYSAASCSRSRRSTTSRRGRKSRRRRGDSLERLISQTILESSAHWNNAEAIAEQSLEPLSPAVSTDAILSDLVQVGAIVEHELASLSGEEEPKPALPEDKLLPSVLSDGGESGDLDIDALAKNNSVPSAPVFFKLTPGNSPPTRSSIGTTTSPTAAESYASPDRQTRGKSSRTTQTFTSSEDPFKYLDEQEAYSSVLWTASEENDRSVSRYTSPIRELEQNHSDSSDSDSTAGSRKDIKPSVTEDGFPIDAETIIDQPVESFFETEWATFDSDDFFQSNTDNKDTSSDASPSSIADFDKKSRRSARSFETNQALVATAVSI